MDWTSQYPHYVSEESEMDESGTGADGEDDESVSFTLPARSKRLTQDVEIADVGCGFGGLLVGLAPLFPDKLILGTSDPRGWLVSSGSFSPSPLYSSRIRIGC